MSSLAALSVRRSFWSRKAPSAAPIRPLVPEIISNLSSPAACGYGVPAGGSPRSSDKVFQTGYHFIIACITVLLGPGLPDFLQGVDDDKSGALVFPDKPL